MADEATRMLTAVVAMSQAGVFFGWVPSNRVGDRPSRLTSPAMLRLSDQGMYGAAMSGKALGGACYQLATVGPSHVSSFTVEATHQGLAAVILDGTATVFVCSEQAVEDFEAWGRIKR